MSVADAECRCIGDMHSSLSKADPEVAELIRLEEDRQQTKLVLIASENYASRAVLEAQGSVLTNKYAENYPGRRYYAGCEFVDQIEQLAIDRAKELFGADHANVQPHAGAQANMAVYFALMNPGDTFMAMDLPHGGHLTHGSPVNFSGKMYNVVPYGVEKDSELLNYDDILGIAKQCKPKVIVAGATAYPRIIDFPRMRRIADEVGAVLMVDMAHIAGLVAAGEHPTPVGHAQIVTTTTHKTLRGPRSGMILCDAEYTTAIDRAVFPGMQGGPLEHVIAAKAVCFREAMTPEFKVYQSQIRKNAGALAEALKERGFRLVSGGTDNHLMMIDVFAMGLTGKAAQTALDLAGIVQNRNMIPFDTQKPWIASGIRLGTPAVTTRGMGEPEMRIIAGLIHRVLADIDDEQVVTDVRQQVRELCAAFPI